jgi:hypothetical protein
MSTKWSGDELTGCNNQRRKDSIYYAELEVGNIRNSLDAAQGVGRESRIRSHGHP